MSRSVRCHTALSAVIAVALALAAPAVEAFVQQGPPPTGRGGTGGLFGFGGSVALSADGNTALIGGNNYESRRGAAKNFSVVQATKPTTCKSSDLKPGRFSHLVAEHTSCSDARKTARAWHGNLACAGNTCTANGYRCTLAFFNGSDGSPSSHQTCARGARRVKFDWTEH
jgi:hypothetical protein